MPVGFPGRRGEQFVNPRKHGIRQGDKIVCKYGFQLGIFIMLTRADFKLPVNILMRSIFRQLVL